MKINASHYEHMLAAIKQLDEESVRSYASNLKESGHFKTFEVRLMWDVARAAGLIPFITKEIYQYANDTHITTALFKIGRQLKFIDGKG